jgi:hypothetical protein
MVIIVLIYELNTLLRKFQLPIHLRLQTNPQFIGRENEAL